CPWLVRWRSVFGPRTLAPRPDQFSTRRCILFHRFAHLADRSNLVVELQPVVALGDGGPDSLDFLDVYRAGDGDRPVGVRFGPLDAVDQMGELAERLARIELRARVVAA